MICIGVSIEFGDTASPLLAMFWDGWRVGKAVDEFTSSIDPCELDQTMGCSLTIFARMLTSPPRDVKKMSNFLR
jgi:hypothetical protein